MENEEFEDVTEIMSEILEKLKLINYEREFLLTKGFMDKPLNKAYFAIQTNTSEQFSYFKSYIFVIFTLNLQRLVKWLLHLLQVKVEFQTYEDPITISQQIITETKKLGLPFDFTALKLKQGFGQEVCQILLSLINLVLQQKFKFKRSQQDSKKQAEDLFIDKEGEAGIELQEDEEEAEMEVEYESEGGDKKQNDEDRQVLQSNIDEKEWLRECERVTPQIQVKVKTNAKEWRAHLSQAKIHSENIRKILPTARQHLESKSDDLSKILERILKAEQNINKNMNELGHEYKHHYEELRICESRYNELSDKVKELGDEYSQLNDKLQKIMVKTSDYGTQMTDSTPLVQIKKALQKLRIEIKYMDLRIGVLNHTVMVHKFKEKKTQDEKIDFEFDQLQIS